MITEGGWGQQHLHFQKLFPRISPSFSHTPMKVVNKKMKMLGLLSPHPLCEKKNRSLAVEYKSNE